MIKFLIIKREDWENIYPFLGKYLIPGTES